MDLHGRRRTEPAGRRTNRPFRRAAFYQCQMGGHLSGTKLHVDSNPTYRALSNGFGTKAVLQSHAHLGFQPPVRRQYGLAPREGTLSLNRGRGVCPFPGASYRLPALPPDRRRPICSRNDCRERTLAGFVRDSRIRSGNETTARPISCLGRRDIRKTDAFAGYKGGPHLRVDFRARAVQVAGRSFCPFRRPGCPVERQWLPTRGSAGRTIAGLRRERYPTVGQTRRTYPLLAAGTRPAAGILGSGQRPVVDGGRNRLCRRDQRIGIVPPLPGIREGR